MNPHHTLPTRYSLLATRCWCLLLAVFFILHSSFCISRAATPAPATLPPWSEGFLDIHHINTGKGESTLLILPDGTTMLVDAGASGRVPPRRTHPQVPDDSRAPGEWIARYIDRALQSAPKKTINYALISHYHDDHYGSLTKANPRVSPAGGYKINGITEVAEHIPIERFIDRSWPKYDQSEAMREYQKFIAWQQKHKGMQPARFQVGANDQFVLLRNPSKYPTFEIRNLAASGVVWTGKDLSTRDIFMGVDPKDIAENKCSTAFRLSYGPFKYFSGGDISSGDLDKKPGETWRDIDTPVAKACGPVSVMKANHHAYTDANSASLLSILRPRVIVIHCWGYSHADINIMRRMKDPNVYPGPRTIFPTRIHAESAQQWGDPSLEIRGHIVIRVSPGGKEYHVYRLTDSDESGLIKSTDGPYNAK